MPTTPIIIKKKVAHAGHHGGAWKVAYADFVTAMMALFIVLWLLNSNKPVREAVGGYFRDPSGTAKKFGSNQVGAGESIPVKKENMADLKELLQKKIQGIVDLEKLRKNIEMTITAEGLRIELLESDKGTFFNSGSANLNESGRNCRRSSPCSWDQFPIIFRLRDTRTQNPTPAQAITPIGNYPPTGPKRRGD